MVLVTGHVRIWYIRKSFHLHLRAESGEGRLILSLLFKCVCLKLVTRLTLKILLKRMLVLWGFFFFFF